MNTAPERDACAESRCAICGEIHRRLSGTLEREGKLVAEYRAGLFACHGNRLLSLGIAIPALRPAAADQAPAACVDVVRRGPGVSVRFADPRESPWRVSGIGRFLSDKELQAGKLRAPFEDMARRIVEEVPLIRDFLFPKDGK
jgi:hypothetical protein